LESGNPYDDDQAANAEIRERVAALETQVSNLWRQLRRAEEGMGDMPVMVSAALARHEDTCAGRGYVLAKLRTSTTKDALPVPPGPMDAEITAQFKKRYLMQPDMGDILPKMPAWKLAIFIGIVIGAAVVAAVSVASRLGMFDLFKAVP
jgi:hypothetical protein